MRKLEEKSLLVSNELTHSTDKIQWRRNGGMTEMRSNRTLYRELGMFPIKNDQRKLTLKPRRL